MPPPRTLVDIATGHAAPLSLAHSPEGLAKLDRDSGEFHMYAYAVQGILREFENSYYQHREGLFGDEEFEVRRAKWKVGMATRGWRELWASVRLTFARDFRAEIDRIVTEVQE